MAKARVTGRVASFSTNRYWIIQNEDEYVWNGQHFIRPTSSEADTVVGFRLRKMADSFRRHIQGNRPDGLVEVIRAPYSLQIRIKTKPVDEGLMCGEKINEETT